MKIHRVVIVLALVSGASVAAELSPAARTTYGKMQAALSGGKCAEAQREYATFRSQAPDFAAENAERIQAAIRKCQQPMAVAPGRTTMKGEANLD